MRIPQVRKELIRHAEWLESEGHWMRGQIIRDLEKELHRRSPVRRSRAKANSVTSNLKQQVLLYAGLRPDASYKEIGEHFDLNTGRVSEILAGYRE